MNIEKIPEKMDWNKLDPPNAMNSFLHLEYSPDVTGVDIALAGVPFDLATSNRPGTKLGPAYLRSRVFKGAKVDEVLDISIGDNLKIVDSGDYKLMGGYLLDAFALIKDQTKKILDAGATPVIVGGDHSITFPELAAYYEVYGPMAMIHFDSHLDTGMYQMCPTKEIYTHGNPFSNAMRKGYLDGNHTIQIGIRTGTPKMNDEYTKEYGREILSAAELHAISYEEAAERIRAKVGDMPCIVTFDIDFLDPVYAPGTGTPVTGGFSVYDALMILETALPGLNIVGADLVEVEPYYDPCEITAISANNILAKLVTCIAYNKLMKKEDVKEDVKEAEKEKKEEK
ncbi:agmatinase [Anaerosporobacter sp.]|uniref:agmatinase n=1 Tax=Anaerosporobacter sp. TaxID=1872529 RepID=UPI00286FA1E1|nr:agmatinase [Anaerosporobacter sp.]